MSLPIIRVASALVTAAFLAGGCFSPSVSECAVTCSAANPCPSGATCLSDGFCHESATDSVCSLLGDAGVDGPPADAAGPCGNGVVEIALGEECDDNNGVSNDGCSDVCAEEVGFVCVEQPSICRPNPSAAGQLVITEILPNPTAAGDEFGEWFEVFNPTTTDFDLRDMTIVTGAESTSVPASLPMPAGTHLVFGISDNVGINGGAPVDFAYGAVLSLSNGGDSIELFFDSLLIDETDYGLNPPGGISLSLSGAAYDAVANDIRANFCDGVGVFGDGDLGTPGEMNPGCI